MTKQNKIVLAIVGGVSLFFVVMILVGIRSLLTSGITAGPDALFGDQHMKTAVALVELHKVRYGSYPAKLSDIKFTGGWDELPLSSVRYIVSKDRQHYYLEVERGWASKPTLDYPAEFWQGTGYDPKLNPSTQ